MLLLLPFLIHWGFNPNKKLPAKSCHLLCGHRAGSHIFCHCVVLRLKENIIYLLFWFGHLKLPSSIPLGPWTSLWNSQAYAINFNLSIYFSATCHYLFIISCPLITLTCKLDCAKSSDLHLTDLKWLLFPQHSESSYLLTIFDTCFARTSSPTVWPICSNSTSL